MPIGSFSYRLLVEQNGRILEGTSLVQNPFAWLTIDMGPSIGTAGDFEGVDVRGVILGIPKSGGPIWVRLQHIYGTYTKESGLDSNGRFTFRNVLSAKWILLVLQGNQVLYSDVTALPSRLPLEIDLRPRN
ncbi:MAG: hypothetical protein KIT09_35150 [Bryobacteraceae bacterium]|nr:hypothetical protein [Bryobacteraceae bacterium]